MEWCGKYWCISAEELTRDDRTASNHSEVLAPILAKGNYDTLVRRKRIRVIRRGGGKGCTALIELESLPEELLAKVRAKYPEAEASKAHLHKVFLSFYEYDHGAFQYYNRTLMRLNQALGNDRLWELAEEYAINVSVIKAVIRLKAETTLFRKVRQGRKVSWAELGEAISFYRDSFGHTLGVTPTRFAQWVRKWEAEGYDGLISKKFGNSSARKVTRQVAQTLAGIDVGDDHRPYMVQVAERFNEFLRGERILFGADGMPIERDDLRDEQGRLPFLSPQTARRYLKHGTTNLLRSLEHDDRHTFKGLHETYNKRKRPEYSLSKISLDDRDLMLKVRWSEQRIDRETGLMQEREEIVSLKVYIAYDVASEAIIGYCFSGKKNIDILDGCVQNMYRTLIAHNLPNPYEAEVENHLVSKRKETSFKAGLLFPVVTWCAPENSQQKRSENFNRLFKYSIEKAHIRGNGRHWSKYEAHRSGKHHGKSSDADNNKYKAKLYDYDVACGYYEMLFNKWNAAPHSEKKRYGGKSRWEVLLENTHPKLEPIDMPSVARWAGRSVSTSIRRNRVQVSGRLFDISSLETLDRLAPRNYKVDAYWWEQEQGAIDEVYLYQDDRFIDVCHEAEAYQEAILERTERDWQLLGKQTQLRKRQAEWMEAHRIGKITTMPYESYKSVEDIEPKAVGVAKVARCEEEDDIDISQYLDKEAARLRAIQSQ